MNDFMLFATPIGVCAIAWNERGIVRLALPERGEREIRATMGAFREARPPAWVKAAARRIQQHLEGDVQDLASLRVDMSQIPPFRKRVYEALLAVKPKETVTYGALAARAGSPAALRAVGQAMAKNPLPLIVPCHRVLASGGRPGGFSAHGGAATKAKILAAEGVTLRVNGTANDEPLFAAQTTNPPPYDAREAVRHLSAQDAKLGALIERAGPFQLRLKQTEGAFLALAESIVYQQLNGKAAATILGRVKALFPRGSFTPKDVLSAKDSDLRGAGLSQSKLLALRDLAEKAELGIVPTMPALAKMSDDEIIQHLTQVRGIGPWTVEMLLIFRLGRPDVLPVTDYGVRQGFQHTFRTRELPKPDQMVRRAETWRPFRSVASWYLWRAVELARS